MIFSLDLRRARKGDCFLIHSGTKEKPGLVMVDGGPKQVYGPHLKPRIDQIRAARKLPDTTPLTVDVLMVSHVDDDHIQGILDLTREMLVKHGAHQPLPLYVLGFWHNSFDAIIGNDATEVTASFKSQFGAASTNGSWPADATIETGSAKTDATAVLASLKVLASIEQGFRLRGDAGTLGFPPNPEFGGQPVVAEKNVSDPHAVAEGLTFRVVGPLKGELDALRKTHDAWLKTLKKKGLTAEQALAAYADTSVANLSSLVVLAECGGKSMLLTGDARGDKVLTGLEITGLVKKGGKLAVTLLKVPHHGSARNLEVDFFKRIPAEHYVFSGNGKHGNPEREALEMLVAARGPAVYTVHLTYPLAETDVERKKDWEKERGREQDRKANAPAAKKAKIKVRPAWSPEKHGLVAFFKSQPKLAKNLRIADEGAAHVIDLGSTRLNSVWPTLG